jgi:hypothetical protein
MALGVFSMRVVALDHYLARPLPGLDPCVSSLEGTAIDQVPVIRVFGSTPSGQKACLHLHQVGAIARCACCAIRCHAGAEAGMADPGPPPAPVRQAFPYFYVPYEDDLPQQPAAGA